MIYEEFFFFVFLELILLSEAKCKAKHGKDLKLLTPKQILQRLQIALPQVKASNTSENLLNNIRHMTDSL